MIEGIITDIKSLAQERPLITSEILRTNDLYGHAYILKRYAGLKDSYQIKGVLEHAAMLFDHVWPNDLAAPFPAHFVFSSHRFPFLRQLTNKALFAIGPSIHYAQPIFSDQEIKEIKRAMGKTLLVFLPHSAKSLLVQYDKKEILSYLKSIEKDFDNILVCVGWRDVLLDCEKPFISEGYTCVTAGHINDRNFLPRLKTLILISTHTMSFGFGTHVGFCVHLNRPHWIVHLKTTLEGPEGIQKTSTYKGTPLGYGYSEHFLKFFKEPLDDITKEQQKAVDFLWGISDIKTSEELMEIFHVTEDMFLGRYYPSNKRDPIFFCQIFDYLIQGNTKKAEFLLNYAKKIDFHPGWISFFRELIKGQDRKSEEVDKIVQGLERYGVFFRDSANLLWQNKHKGDSLKKIKENLYKMYPRPQFYQHRKMELPWKREVI